ncbi:hypothetical protein [Pedobacter sp. Leaf170]|uniref:hypothetical protein n=1 Tax=Pedobacter sp. Leaf170 TaxID=2876558 RepID=UPI001E5C7117|nr:hypothetical protein [Pedobacter sp. Leaf170]
MAIAIGLIIFIIIGAVIVSIASESGKKAEGAIGGSIMGVIIFAGVLMFIVIPLLFLKGC